MQVRHFIHVLLLVAATSAAAQGMSMPMKPAASANKPGMPLVSGEVRKIDTQKGLIVLRHGEIPNLGMPAMTMGFDIADKKLLDGVKAGQKVRFQAEMIHGKATVTQLERVR
jgi:Cu(I)/Ag(I) efflux system membrane protein CusA/SilA